MNITEKYARINLACNYYLSGRNFLLLLEKYKSAEAIIKNYPKFSQSNFITKKEKENPFEKIKLDEVVVFGEDFYPQSLIHIPDPPIALFTKGNLVEINFDKTIAVVGTRKISKYGIEVTTKLVDFLVSRGYTVVSGLAYGIDTLAHELTLACGGQTIAVLGTDINYPYPQVNTNLYKKIIENHGLVLSEFYFKEDYGKWVFPRRNRIIAGLCKKIIIIEAPVKSGALITANYGFEFNREVFAVPGSINCENSAGTNLLIKNNKAQILTSFEDLIEGEQLFFGSEMGQQTLLSETLDSPLNIVSRQTGNNLVEKNLLKRANIMEVEKGLVYGLIKQGVNSFELLVQKCNYDINILFEILGYLELHEFIKRHEDGTYMIN